MSAASSARPGGQHQRVVPGPPDHLHRGGQAVLGRPAGSASAGQPSALNGNVKSVNAAADLDLDDVGARGDEPERRREQQVEALERRLRPLGELARRADGGLVLGVVDGDAALDLAADVLAVELGVARDRARGARRRPRA